MASERGYPRLSAEIAAELRAWLERTGTTQAQVASRLRVSQPRISRILAGDFSSRSATARKFCALARVPVSARAGTRRADRRLVAAFYDAWDGTDEERKRLERLLRAAAVWNAERTATRSVRRRRSRGAAPTS
jgi:transcriptional regulator with XRE-family HTH domain